MSLALQGSIVARMSTPFSEYQVLVVGAGPTGLVLVVPPLTRGIRTRIVDTGDGPAGKRCRRAAPDVWLAPEMAICRGL
jgi:cation diffusion facilitator CzcD-associated flavoprotein CzcO